jgi:hypothetical protein
MIFFLDVISWFVVVGGGDDGAAVSDILADT